MENAPAVNVSRSILWHKKKLLHWISGDLRLLTQWTEKRFVSLTQKSILLSCLIRISEMNCGQKRSSMNCAFRTFCKLVRHRWISSAVRPPWKSVSILALWWPSDCEIFLLWERTTNSVPAVLVGVVPVCPPLWRSVKMDPMMLCTLLILFPCSGETLADRGWIPAVKKLCSVT